MISVLLLVILSLTCQVTAYCPCEICCGQWADFVTASGHEIEYGDKLIAAPSYISFGTEINIPGYGRAKVLDRGGSIKGNRLDILFYERSPDPTITDLEWSHQLALDWGVKYLIVIETK